MTLVASISQQALYEKIQPVLADWLGLDPSLVLQGLPNRAAMPLPDPGYVTMQLTNTARLRTNIDSWDETDLDPSTLQIEQGTKVRMQLDLYGASSGDWAIILSAVLRDEVGCDALADVCQPLFTGDPILAPLEDSESQYEARWIIEALLQYNPVISAPMQFFDEAVVTLVNVDERYPP